MARAWVRVEAYRIATETLGIGLVLAVGAITLMSQALTDLTQSVTDAEAKARGANAERADLFARLNAALAAAPPPPPTDDEALAALKVRVDALGDSLAVPVASLTPPVEAPAEPAPPVTT